MSGIGNGLYDLSDRKFKEYCNNEPPNLRETPLLDRYYQLIGDIAKKAKENDRTTNKTNPTI